jgi:hypothetical protein
MLVADVPRAKAELSKHCTAITLTPEAARMVPGARIVHYSHGLSPQVPFQIELAA